MKYPTTPDGRYFVVKTILWRSTNPALSPERRASLQKDLMDARRALRKDNLKNKTDAEVRAIRDKVDEAKVALGERGPLWWEDEGDGDLNRHSVRNSPYKEWFEGLGGKSKSESSKARPTQEQPVAKPKLKSSKTTTAKEPKTRTAARYGLRSGD